MTNILTLNEISKKIYDVLDTSYDVAKEIADPIAILVRSYAMHEYPINVHLRAVARAGAGVNNIPLDKMTDNNVVVFNTPGANANAVKELVICGMLLSCRDIVNGISWTNNLTGDDVPKQVEKGKSKFGGIEIIGKTVGVVGLGAIGVLVANALLALGMKVIGYDPYLTETNKNNLNSAVKVVTLEEIFAQSNFITLHVPLIESTKNIIDQKAISLMNNDVTILNFSRDGLVNIEALKAGISAGKIRNYVVDLPTADILNCKNIIALPHLGASTEEAEDNCAIMAATELKDYLENGNITNSVNFPNLYKKQTASHRLAVIFNSNILSTEEIKNYFKTTKVEFAYVSKGNIGYILADSNDCLCDILHTLEKVNGVRKVTKFKI